MSTADRFHSESLVETDSSPDVPEGTVRIYNKLTNELVYEGPIRGRSSGNGGCLIVFNPEDYDRFLAAIEAAGMQPVSIQ